MQKPIFLTCVGLSIFSMTMAQQSNRKDNFSHPLSIKPRLNANFGEMRPNHFHMGLDYNTVSRENLPVFAPADGYISRIKIESGGFGRALYVTHFNGTTSVYAHMNSFLPVIESYLEKKQYEQESWKIDLQVPKGQFEIKRGQLLGYSGNTGASEGPHLHFELRDTKTENCLNPLTNGISISDQMAPIIKQLAFYDYEKSIYEQTPKLINVIKKGASYVAAQDIELSFEKVVVGIVASDLTDGSPNQNGIYQAYLLDGKERIAGFTLENIPYDFTRNQNGHIDFSYRFRGGAYVQLLHRPKFFQLDVYPKTFNKPFLPNGNNYSNYQIEVSDACSNRAYVSFKLKKNGTAPVQQKPGLPIFFGKMNTYDKMGIKFDFQMDAFYDSFHMNVSVAAPTHTSEKSPSYKVEPSSVPVNSYFQVSILPVLDKMDTARILMRKIVKNKVEVKKAVWQKSRFIASFREFGSFQLIEDIEPPELTFQIKDGTVIKKGDLITVLVSDNHKSIKSVDVRADGKWLMFKPDGNKYTYRVDEHLSLGEHLLQAVVLDEAGNQTVSKITIKRL